MVRKKKGYGTKKNEGRRRARGRKKRHDGREETAEGRPDSQITLDQPLPSFLDLRALPLLSQRTRSLAHHPLDLFPDDLQVPAQNHRVQALLLSIFPGGLVEVLFLQSRRDGAEDLLFF
jgi:hypothetical protein